MDHPLVAEALQKARYNEIVSLSIEGQEINLIPCLDTENGGIQWNPIPSDQVLKRHLRTKQWIFPMLNDRHRNKLYEQAIEKACSRCGTDSGSSIVQVIDIGAGSGLLGMMAARSLQRNGCTPKVTAVEMADAMARIASEIAQDNGFSRDIITVIDGHSCQIPPLEPKARICVSELLEDGLLGEGILPSIKDAHSRHVEKDCLVIPHAARVYVQLVEAPWITNYAGPYLQFESLSLYIDQQSTPMLPSSLISLPVHASKLLKDKELRILSAPVEIFSFYLQSDELLPGDGGERRTVSIKTNEAGTVHGFLLWWELDIDEDLIYSMEPGIAPFQDHWHQTLQILAQDEIQSVSKGEAVTIAASHDNARISVRFHNNHDYSASKRSKLSLDPLISPMRASQLNDTKRIQIISKAVQHALEQKGNDASILDISDFSLCACLAAMMGATQVRSIETSSGQVPMTAASVAQISNGLPKEGRTFEILQCHAETLSLTDLGCSTVDILLAEPYYEILEGWHLQEALNFFYLSRALRRREILSRSAAVVPGCFRLMACLVECEQLRSAYRYCGDENNSSAQVSGFCHRKLNELASFDESDFPLSIFQYDFISLTGDFEITQISYNGDMDLPLVVQCTGNFVRPGSCDALLVWVDYGVQTTEGFTWLTTNDRSHKQLVKMISNPVEINTDKDTKQSFSISCFIGTDDPIENHKFSIFVHNE